MIGRAPLGSLGWPAVLRKCIAVTCGLEKKVGVLKGARARDLEYRNKTAMREELADKRQHSADIGMRPAARVGV